MGSTAVVVAGAGLLAVPGAAAAALAEGRVSGAAAALKAASPCAALLAPWSLRTKVMPVSPAKSRGGWYTRLPLATAAARAPMRPYTVRLGWLRSSSRVLPLPHWLSAGWVERGAPAAAARSPGSTSPSPLPRDTVPTAGVTVRESRVVGSSSLSTSPSTMPSRGRAVSSLPSRGAGGRALLLPAPPKVMVGASFTGTTYTLCCTCVTPSLLAAPLPPSLATSVRVSMPLPRTEFQALAGAAYTR